MPILLITCNNQTFKKEVDTQLLCGIFKDICVIRSMEKRIEITFDHWTRDLKIMDNQPLQVFYLNHCIYDVKRETTDSKEFKDFLKKCGSSVYVIEWMHGEIKGTKEERSC